MQRSICVASVATACTFAGASPAGRSILLPDNARANAGARVRAAQGQLTSPLTNPQARAAWLKVAAEIHGTGPADYNAVANAWSAASVV